MVTRRLDADERQMISSGSVYVWEERGHQTDLTGVSTIDKLSATYFSYLHTDHRWASSGGQTVRIRLPPADKLVLICPLQAFDGDRPESEMQVHLAKCSATNEIDWLLHRAFFSTRRSGIG